MEKFTAVYYRVSKKTKNNIKMQQDVCRKYCELNNISNFVEYRDIGVRGYRKNKPALNKLLLDAQSGRVNKILVYKIDRLGRSFFQLNNLSEKLENLGVDIYSATQKFNFNNREGRLILRILMVMSDFESGITSDRVKDGLRARKSNLSV